MYRETAFIHALTAAALTFSIARACSEGKLVKCKCGTDKQQSANAHASWRWGGCNDNTQHGKRLARNFLDLHITDGDQVSEILRHNSEVRLIKTEKRYNMYYKID